MTADKNVEALRARVLREADNAAGRGVRLADMTFSVEGDTLVALCRRWLEATHCDNCGCDWLDNGLNPIGCPYCKESPAIGEEIMVNAAHGVFTLPLQPSGLLSGPRFVVHVPGPEKPVAVDDLNTWRAAFVAERAMRYREGGMAIEQARIHAETDAARMAVWAAAQQPEPEEG